MKEGKEERKTSSPLVTVKEGSGSVALVPGKE